MAEIEKKWRLDKVPPSVLINSRVEIRQGYLLAKKEGEVRIRETVREKQKKYSLTVKRKGGLSRDEWETEIPEWVFETLWPYTEGQRVEKARYVIEEEGSALKVDEYHGSLKGLITLECEFQSEKEAESFILPGWASSAEEVTDNEGYKNKNLALYGLPERR